MRMSKKHRLGAVITSAVMSVGTFMSVSTSTASAAGVSNYAQILQYSLYFYDANMCGDGVQSKCGLSWRGNCHTDDAVKGGFHDAGDHAMFGLPQGYTATALGLSYDQFKDAYQATGQTDHLKMITDYFCDFFRRSTELSGDSVSRFLYQKGDGNADHAYWGKPENQGAGRKMFWTSSGASDIAANYAAALALNYKNFGNAKDLQYAKALYNFAKRDNSCATDGPHGFYNSSKCEDELAMAAGCLAYATGDAGYKSDFTSRVGGLGVYWCYGWNDANLGAAVMNGLVNKDWSKANSYLGGMCKGSDYLYMDKWGSARINASMQFMALVASKNSGTSYVDWAVGQMNYLTGANNFGYSFIVGIGDKYPMNAHHRAASGYNNYDELGSNKSAAANSPILIGALVGGPWNGDKNSSDKGSPVYYQDDISDYIGNEVALDYNAGLVGAAAGLYHFKKSGSVSSNIPGVTKIYSSSSVIDEPQQTDAPPQQTEARQTQPQSDPEKNGDTVTLKVNQAIDYSKLPENDKMLGFKYEDFGLKPGDPKIKQVKVNISANGNIGKWQGAFGSSTTDANADPAYWTQTKDMQETFSSNKGTIVWDVPTATSNIIQYGYDGALKFGIWWIDCQQFNIDSIDLVLEGSAPQQTEARQTEPQQPDETTKAPQTVKVTKRGDVDCNGDVNVADAVMLARYNAEDKGVDVKEQGLVNADLDSNGRWNSQDLMKLLEIIAGLAS